MSVLETPRIYFRGQVSWDPITTNNYSQRYDEFTGATVFPQVVDKVKAFRAQAIADVAGGGVADKRELESARHSSRGLLRCGRVRFQYGFRRSHR
jgi:hypothetical protein